MKIQEFFDPDTYTLTYVVFEEGQQTAIVIDPVLDYCPNSGRVTETSINQVLAYLKDHNLKPVLALETHAHADHISGSQILKRHFPDLKVAISDRITQVQEIFVAAFNMDAPTDGRQFDLLIKDHETLEFAGLKIQEIPTPGHTPACSSFLIGDAVFTGDALFQPDYGVGRCDFPGGDAGALFDSITERLYTMPDSTRVFTGHDYQPNGRQLAFESTIGEQKRSNIILNAKVTRAAFVEKRETRDQTLTAPRLLLPSIQVNIMAGHLPEPEANGARYLKLPIKMDVS